MRQLMAVLQAQEAIFGQTIGKIRPMHLTEL
jgi:hypothetical protein